MQMNHESHFKKNTSLKQQCQEIEQEVEDIILDNLTK
jgi:hypothetical protein